jgi:uncharacterized protein (DUF488 family)
MDVFTIGFSKKTAQEFFGRLKAAGIRRVLDIRLNNYSQLAGFTKRADLPFFLKELGGIEYVHVPELAPTKEILDAFKKKKGSWEDYERSFLELLARREVAAKLDRALFSVPCVLLCSEAKPDHCHRRLVAEYLQEKWGDVTVAHL